MQARPQTEEEIDKYAVPGIHPEFATEFAGIRSGILFMNILQEEVGLPSFKQDRNICDLMGRAVLAAGLCDADSARTLYEQGISALVALALESPDSLSQWLDRDRQLEEVRPLIFALSASYSIQMNSLARFAAILRSHPPQNGQDITEYVNVFHANFSESERAILVGKPTTESDLEVRVSDIVRRASEYRRENGRGILQGFYNPRNKE